MKIVVLERNSVGTDTPVDCYEKLGEVTYYPNTVTPQEVAERVKDADVIVGNKAPFNEESLKDAPNVKLQLCHRLRQCGHCLLQEPWHQGLQRGRLLH